MPPFLFFPDLVNRLFGCAPQDDRGRQECIGIIEVPESYSGPRLQFPLNTNSLTIMIEAFKKQQVSGSIYTALILVHKVFNDYLLNE